MKPFSFFYRFTKGQQKGVMALFILIIVLQALYFVLMSKDLRTDEQQSAEEKEWIALQDKINELKAKKGTAKETVIYPFNPNFISDYKGYTLGMSVEEIDRLHDFRKTGKFINSAQDFKNVTKVSDSLLAEISPYFKFPDWVNKQPVVGNTQNKKRDEQVTSPHVKSIVIDINDALEEDLDKAYGIGPAFAKKILRRRALLGGYVNMEQMEDFNEFSPEAKKELKKLFAITKPPQVNKVNINSASLNQLSYFPYFDKSIAKSIITYRSMKGKINNVEELLNINGFPVDKIQIIALYLEF